MQRRYRKCVARSQPKVNDLPGDRRHVLFSKHMDIINPLSIALPQKTNTRNQDSKFQTRNSSHWIILKIGKHTARMCTSQEESLGKSVCNMAQSIISMCSCTWSQERRISVLLRTIEPPLSIWDCVPENIIDAHLKDAFEYLPDQRDYILFYAIPGSAVVRSIRRLDGYRATPLVLKSLHFSKDEDTDAYNFPPEADFTEDFSESEYCEDGTSSRDWTLTPTSTSELDDNEINTSIRNDASETGDQAELGDEVVRCKSQQWNEYPKSEKFEVFITPLQQSAAPDVDDEASSPEPRSISPLHQSHPESEDDLKDDEPPEANNRESRPFFRLHHSHPESEDDLKDDEPLEANDPGSRPFSQVHQSYQESDDALKDDEPLEANNPEPRPLSPMNKFYPESDEPLEVESPEPQQLLPAHHFYPEFDDYPKYQQDDDSLEADIPQPRRLLPAQQSHPELDDFHKYRQEVESRESDSPEPRHLFTAHQYYPEFDHYHKYQQDDDSLEADIPQPRRILPAHQFHPELDDYHKYPQEVESLEADSPEPRHPLPAHQFYPDFDYYDKYQQDDDSLEADSPQPRHLLPAHQFHPELDDYHKYPQEVETLKADSAEPRHPLPAHQFYLEFDYYHKYQQDDESLEADSPETLFDLQPAPQMEILCPKPIRGYPTHRVILEPELFEDWFVDMSEPIFIDDEVSSPDQSVSETPNPEQQNLVPIRCDTPHPEFNDEEPHKANSPKPRRFYPVNQFKPMLYDSRPVFELDHEGVESLEIWSLYH